MSPAEGSDSEGSDGGSKSGSGKGVIVLDQEDHRIPSEEEVFEYAEYLGIDIDREKDLLWIAREGVTAPVPAPWKACTENGDDIFYFNFESGESIWEHPSDEHYKKLLQEKRMEKSAAKIVRSSKTAADAAGSASASAEESFSGSGSLSVSDKAPQRAEAQPSEAIDESEKSSKDVKDSKDAKETKTGKDAVDPSMPSKGLAGVGLAGARLEVPSTTPAPKKEAAAGSKKGEGSAEEVAEEEGLEGSASRSGTRGSSKDSKDSKGKQKEARHAEPEPHNRSGSGSGIAGSDAKAGSEASELSEDFMSDMGSPNSSFIPGVGVTRVRSNSVGGDTMELSVSASVSAVAGDGEESVLEKAVGGTLESDIASLSRSLAVLQRIRESQKKYLELLLHGGAL